MTKITIDYQDGMTVKYEVPDHISDALEALISMYPHTVLEYKKEEDSKQ